MITTVEGTESPRERNDLNIADRVRSISKETVDYIHNDQFENLQDELTVEASELLAELESRPPTNRDGKEAYMHGLGDIPLLSREEEVSYFRAMNFLKHQIVELKNRLKGSRHPECLLIEIQQLSDGARQFRDHLIHSNIRLVISIVRKFASPQLPFDELMSEGMVTLMQAVDKFNYDRGFRFSTYAYRSVSRALYQSALKLQQEESFFIRDADSWAFEAAEADVPSSLTEQMWHAMKDQMARMLKSLDRREQFIIRGRYAISPHRKTKTFQALADKLGISKERVRQLEQRAVQKLQSMAANANLEASQ